MRIRSAGLAVLVSTVVAGFLIEPPQAAAQAAERTEVASEELRAFTAIFAELRDNAAGFPGAEPPEERRESVEIIEEHGWTLQQYNRIASLINSDRELFQEFSRALEE